MHLKSVQKKLDGFFISKKFQEISKMKPYIAINASAGSGKTYTLVQRVLMICLENPYHIDAIRHILALNLSIVPMFKVE